MRTVPRMSLGARLGLGALVLAAALAVLGPRVLRWVWARPAPPPARTEARDLPPLPDPDENGWWAIAGAPEGTWDDPPDWAHDVLADEGPPSVERFEAARGAIEAWSISDATRSSLDRALGAPRFAIDCALEIAVECPSIEWLHAHRLAVAITLRDLALGWDEDALARAERLLVADRDVLATARTLVQAMIAGIAAAQAIELAGAIGAVLGAREESALGAEVTARVDALDLALVSLDPARWSIERALIGESILARSAVDAIVESGEGRFGAAPAAEALDRYYEDAIAYARDPEHVAPPQEIEEDRLGWMVDPFGALLTSTAMGVAVVPQIDRFRALSAHSVERVEIARVALAAARARVASAP